MLSLLSGGNKITVVRILLILGVTVGLATAMDLKTICNSTSYPDLCYNRLAPIVQPPGDDTGLQEAYRLSVRIAIDELSRVSNDLLKLEEEFKNASDPQSLSALELCHDVLSTRALTSLNDSLAMPNDTPTTDKFKDLETWITASGIYHQTCIDAFDDAMDVSLRSAVLQKLKNSTELASISLAILLAYEESVANNSKSSNGKSRRLMGSGDMPRWFSHRERKLLESTLDNIHIDVVVAKDGSGNFNNITDALKAAPNCSARRFVIYVKAGVYREILIVDVTKSNIMMIGDGMDATIVSGSLCAHDGITTYYTATFTVLGAGFIARDMRFENAAGAAMGQAVALKVDSDKGVFYRCKLAGYQDTLLAQAYRHFFSDCHIIGTIDFIFGYSTAVFENTKILPRKPAPGQSNVITAQGKYESRIKSGFSFINCTISPAENLIGVSTFLGRPWKSYSTAVFMYTHMESLIDPNGWMPSKGYTAPDTIYYGEYKNTGPGSETYHRVPWKGLHLAMTTSEAEMFTVNALIDGRYWLPGTGIHYTNEKSIRHPWSFDISTCSLIRFDTLSDLHSRF